ncbi:xanthine dehydrogenase accessory protein XdhC [Ornithinicoccus halotolerans]|uniref:xanthine dehydrogenase accessory protein XdhC n=1 Tax=Ornithinicoccus halotolerans TaxID=1748220 RepID=UPI001296F59D|nr:xanthine dehydrogenase accessory protein XdhC [Ornithinicoccus halotolerans]
MDWLTALARWQQEGQPCVLVTVLQVRGHAPRDPGAKMVVAREGSHGSVGGGNLEAECIDAARALLAQAAEQARQGSRSPAAGAMAARALPPRTVELGLSEHAPTRHGRQCCGGTVQVLLEHLPARRAVAVFGAGHVGLELCRILTRLDLRVDLVDSRADRLALAEEIPPGAGELVRHHAAAPESVLPTLPPGTDVLVMTHDHAEDLAVLDAALRSDVPGRIGVIGSSAKWSRFQVRLAREGHGPEAIARVRCPIGLPEVKGKEPAVIAVSVAAELLSSGTQAGAATRPRPLPGPRPVPGAGAAS